MLTYIMYAPLFAQNFALQYNYSFLNLEKEDKIKMTLYEMKNEFAKR